MFIFRCNVDGYDFSVKYPEKFGHALRENGPLLEVDSLSSELFGKFLVAYKNEVQSFYTRTLVKLSSSLEQGHVIDDMLNLIFQSKIIKEYFLKTRWEQEVKSYHFHNISLPFNMHFYIESIPDATGHIRLMMKIYYGSTYRRPLYNPILDGIPNKLDSCKELCIFMFGPVEIQLEEIVKQLDLYLGHEWPNHIKNTVRSIVEAQLALL
jgi:hypothetical protein